MLSEYDAVISEQLEHEVVMKAPEKVEGKEFYLPQRTLVRVEAETTKLRIVYDASAHAHSNAPSLNKCLHAGPTLKKKLWSVLIRNRFHAVAVAGDLRKAFLQVRIRETERDALRFHWIVNKHNKKVETLRFTRVLFGLAPSPFLFGGVIQQHLETWKTCLPESVSEVLKSLYVDDITTGVPTIPAAKQLKCEATEIFADAKFELHKWHSNEPELETNCENYKPTFAKQQLGSTFTPGKGKLLGVPWDKSEDILGVTFSNSPAKLTKQGILANLAKVYDPLGLVSPMMLDGKRIYRETCNQKITWDAPLAEVITRQWIAWEKQLPTFLSTQLSLANFREPIQEVQLHTFGDASGYGVSAAVYAVIMQDSGVTQGLVTTKSRFVKQGLTIPCLELVSGHMAANLAVNVCNTLQSFPLATNIQCWLVTTVALHWLSDNGEYRQLTANCVQKIQGHTNLMWRYVPTSENPADLRSRGGSVTKAELWWRGPAWLADPKKWPTDIVTHATQESQAERKVQRELFAGTVEVNHDFDHVLEKFGLRKALRVCAWILRFTLPRRP